MSIEIGQQAPDFRLKDQEKNEVSLTDFSGKRVVLAFHPFAFTGICETELCALRDEMSDFEQLGATTLVISTDSVATHAEWAKQQGFGFRYLSDFWPHGETAKAYGVFNEKAGAANRATFIIDEQGKVVHADVQTEIPGEARDVASYRKVLENLPTPA